MFNRWPDFVNHFSFSGLFSYQTADNLIKPHQNRIFKGSRPFVDKWMG